MRPLLCKMLCLVPSVAAVAPTILISFDGMRADYLTTGRVATPHFDALATAGVHAVGGMTPSFVTKTFPNHWTLVTGLHEESHGIVGNHMRDPAYPGSYFTMASTDGHWWRGAEPIWSTVERLGGRAAVGFWPGSAASGLPFPPSLSFGPYNGSMPFGERIDAALRWLTVADAAARPDLVCLYFEEPDRQGHAYGPESSEVTAAIALADATLGQLLDGLATAGLWGQNGDYVNIVVLADHGMVATSPNRVVTLSNYVDDIDLLVETEGVDTSPVVGLWPTAATADDAPALVAKLRAAPQLAVYEKHELPARWHYRGSNRVAPVTAVAQEGWSIRVDSNTPLANFCCGSHGYDNGLPSMRPIFLARGPAFKRGIALPGPDNDLGGPAFANVDVQPLLARVLELNTALLPPVNGSLAAVLPLLRPHPPAPAPPTPAIATPPTPTTSTPSTTPTLVSGGGGGGDGCGKDRKSGVLWPLLSALLAVYGSFVSLYALQLRRELEHGNGFNASAATMACAAAFARCAAVVCPVPGRGVARPVRLRGSDEDSDGGQRRQASDSAIAASRIVDLDAHTNTHRSAQRQSVVRSTHFDLGEGKDDDAEVSAVAVAVPVKMSSVTLL